MATNGSTNGTNGTKKLFERLPTDVKPKHYRLTIDTDLKGLTFTGSLSVDLYVKQETSKIVLNVRDLDVSDIVLKSAGNATRKPTDVKLSKKEETLVISFAQPLVLGAAQLEMSFRGVLNEKLHGFYRTKYTINGEERWAATTQFAATNARSAFPCFDEPAIKSRFDITLICDKNLVALSNMDVVKEEVDSANPEKKVLSFATSPIMSTYLVAFTIGECFINR